MKIYFQIAEWQKETGCNAEQALNTLVEYLRGKRKLSFYTEFWKGVQPERPATKNDARVFNLHIKDFVGEINYHPGIDLEIEIDKGAYDLVCLGHSQTPASFAINKQIH